MVVVNKPPPAAELTFQMYIKSTEMFLLILIGLRVRDTIIKLHDTCNILLFLHNNRYWCLFIRNLGTNYRLYQRIKNKGLAQKVSCRFDRNKFSIKSGRFNCRL